MGKVCEKCGASLNVFTNPAMKIYNKILCRNCFKTEKAMIVEEKNNSFEKTAQVENYFWIDDKNKKWLVPNGVFKKGININTEIYSYNDIFSYELLSNNSAVVSGGVSVGRALVGGALFGGAGAVLGGLSGNKKIKNEADLTIKITLNDISCPPVYIRILKTPSNVNGIVFKQASQAAQNILSMLDIMTSQKVIDQRPEQ